MMEANALELLVMEGMQMQLFPAGRGVQWMDMPN